MLYKLKGVVRSLPYFLMEIFTETQHHKK